MNKALRVFLIGITLMLFTTAGRAGEPDVKVGAFCDRKDVYIGQRLRLTVSINSSSPINLKLPKFTDGKIGEFEIKDTGSYEKKRFFGRRSYFFWYDLAIYMPGSKAIPSIEVSYSANGSLKKSVVMSNVVNITVLSVLPRGKTLTDIKDVKGGIGYFEIAPAFIVGLFLFVICLFIVAKIIRHIQRGKIKTPREIAIETLGVLKTAYSAGSDVDTFFAGMSDCVRHYIEQVFSIKAPEMTTEEFLVSLNDSTVLVEGQKTMLRKFLSACDMVKFAKYRPAGTELEAVFSAAQSFIETADDLILAAGAADKEKKR